MLEKLWQQEIGRRIADMGLAMMEGHPEKIHEIKDLIEKSEDGFVPDDEVEPVTTSVEELLEYTANENCWEFNIPSLAKTVRGGKGGEFMIAFARPEIGKTAFYVSLAAATKWLLFTRCECSHRNQRRTCAAYDATRCVCVHRLQQRADIHESATCKREVCRHRA